MIARGRREKSEEQKARGAALGARIKKLREAGGFSQPALASASGIALATIQKIERKKGSEPGVFTLWDIAEALRTNLLELVPPKSSDSVPKRQGGKK
jgi:transcriptional regulator with XRE-family HTH domain